MQGPEASWASGAHVQGRNEQRLGYKEAKSGLPPCPDREGSSALRISVGEGPLLCGPLLLGQSSYLA